MRGLFSLGAASWIGAPDYALFEETLARGLGLWRCPSWRWCCCCWLLCGAGEGCAIGLGQAELLDQSGLIPSC